MMTAQNPRREPHQRSARALWANESDVRPLQVASAAVGTMFLLVGIAGFIPGVTTDYDQLSGAGHESTAELLGLFQISVLHNVVHLLFGVLGLVAALRRQTAQAFLVGGGAVYLGLALYGVVVDRSSDANFVPVNTADNWLHLGLGLGMIALGVLLRERQPSERAGAPR